MQRQRHGDRHSGHSTVDFTPRPEAQAYPWESLLTPIRNATRDLILWMEAAYDASTSPREEDQLATSLLVSGERGSGKTTVLLTTAYALQKPEAFLSEDTESSETGDSESRQDKEQVGSALHRLYKRVLWMAPLDLEPLPASANLLATLLVRVRSALDQAYGGPHREGWAPPSILEEQLENPWGLIDGLIRDATFVWEGISEGDLRLRADQQIKAAEIYAEFQKSFRDAMDSVSRALSQRDFGRGDPEHAILVIPIDNVDRSVEHIHRIMSLMRMVTSRRLWFVLAAARPDFQLFLERSFEQELAVSSKADSGPEGRDETQAIARRQAAGAMRRLLPPIHRVVIESVLFKDAWRFCPSYMPDERSLGELLATIPLPLQLKADDLGKEFKGLIKGKHLASFSDLFDLLERLWLSAKTSDTSREASEHLPPSSIRRFTHMGRLALTMPARPLLDLWQATLREVERGETHPDSEAAIRIANDMLFNAINESDLPGWASTQLLHRIIRRDTWDRIILDMADKPLRVVSSGQLLGWWRLLPPEGDGPGVSLHAQLRLSSFAELRLILHDPENPQRRADLPANVAGWFMLLFDLLMLFPHRRVLNFHMDPRDMSLGLVSTKHIAALDGNERVFAKFWWLPPDWRTFTEFSIFTAQWMAFLRELEVAFGRPLFQTMRQPQERLVRLIQAAWFDNACSVAGENPGDWMCPKPQKVLGPGRTDPLEDYERKVGERFTQLVGHGDSQSLVGIDSQLHASAEGFVGANRLWLNRLHSLARWAHRVLPLLFEPEFTCAPFPVQRPALIPEWLWQVWREDRRLIEQERHEFVMRVLADSMDATGDSKRVLRASKRWFEQQPPGFEPPSRAEEQRH